MLIREIVTVVGCGKQREAAKLVVCCRVSCGRHRTLVKGFKGGKRNVNLLPVHPLTCTVYLCQNRGHWLRWEVARKVLDTFWVL